MGVDLVGVDLVGVDFVGVDFMGVDLVGFHPSPSKFPRQFKTHLQRPTT